MSSPANHLEHVKEIEEIQTLNLVDVFDVFDLLFMPCLWGLPRLPRPHPRLPGCTIKEFIVAIILSGVVKCSGLLANFAQACLNANCTANPKIGNWQCVLGVYHSFIAFC